MKHNIYKSLAICQKGPGFSRRDLYRAAAVLILSVTVLPAATLTLWQNETAGRIDTNHVTVRLEGERCRIDVSPVFTILFDAETGYGYQLLHPAKSYIRQPLAEMQTNTPCAEASSAAPIPTGNTRTIAGHTAYEYRVTNACGRRHFWLAPDYPDWQKLQTASAPAIARLSGRANLPTVNEGLSGMILHTETIAPHAGLQGATMTNRATLISATIVPDDPAAMSIPADYREVKAFPTGPQTNQVSRLLARENARIQELMSTNSNPLASLSNGPRLKSLPPAKPAAHRLRCQTATLPALPSPRGGSQPEPQLLPTRPARTRHVIRRAKQTSAVLSPWVASALIQIESLGRCLPLKKRVPEPTKRNATNSKLDCPACPFARPPYPRAKGGS